MASVSDDLSAFFIYKNERSTLEMGVKDPKHPKHPKPNIGHKKIDHFKVVPCFLKISKGHVGHSSTVQSLGICRVCLYNLHNFT